MDAWLFPLAKSTYYNNPLRHEIYPPKFKYISHSFAILTHIFHIWQSKMTLYLCKGLVLPNNEREGSGIGMELECRRSRNASLKMAGGRRTELLLLLFFFSA